MQMLIHDDRLSEMLVSFTEILRRPAGEEFKSIEDCLGHRSEFICRFHSGLQTLHFLAIGSIVKAEQEALKAKSEKRSKSQKEAWRYLRQVFRAVNDSIVWTLFGMNNDPAFLVRRICRFKDRARGYLKDQNPESIMRFLEERSANGRAVAIWNDATRCVDLAGVTVFEGPNRITFSEIKEGTVNDQVLNLATKSPSDVGRAVDEFLSKYGKSGLEQLRRTARQALDHDKLLTLFKQGDIQDPFLGVYRQVFESDTIPDTYDSELRSALISVRERDYEILAVDGCLHILLVNANRITSSEEIKRLATENIANSMRTPEEGQADCRGLLLDYQSGFFSPTAMPVFLRSLEAEDIRRICMGETRVIVGFDLNTWGGLLKTSRLEWSSVKDGRRERTRPIEKRLLLVDHRIPILTAQDGKERRLGPVILHRVVFQGVRPAAEARMCDEAFSQF